MSAQTVFCEKCSAVHGVSTYHSPDSHKELDRDSHIANIEWAVITNAVAWRKASLKEIASSPTYRLEKLAEAVDALIAAREAELKEE